MLEHGVEGDLERGRVATDLSQQQSPFNGGEGPTGGIGFEVARALADEGADVIISGRNTERGEEAAQALGAKARFVLVDLTELDAVRALAEAAGDVDVLVNNAVAFIGGPAVEQDVESFEESFAANVRGPCFPTAVLVPKMFAKRGGAIVNVSTVAASLGIQGISVYGATKAAVESLTGTWAAEFAGGGVRVNSVAPGPTRSGKVKGIMEEAAEQPGQATPLARMASTAEIAEVVLFLTSDRSGYVTGATLAADGRRTAV